MLPDLIPFGHLRQAQAVGQDGLNERLAGHAVGEVDHDHGAFGREGEKAHLIASHGHGQRYTGQDRQVGVGFAVFGQYLQVYRVPGPEVVADTGLGRGIGHALHQGESGQVVTAAQLGELTFYGAFYCFFHFKPI